MSFLREQLIRNYRCAKLSRRGLIIIFLLLSIQSWLIITSNIEFNIHTQGLPVDRRLAKETIIGDNKQALISNKAVLINGIFYLEEKDDSSHNKSIQWPIGSYPDPKNLNASISFVPSLDSLFQICDESINHPSILVKFVSWPQYGHTMFNVISNIYQTVQEMNVSLPNVRLYGVYYRSKTFRKHPPVIVDLKVYATLFRKLTDQPIYNYYSLLKNSFVKVQCFTNGISIGVSKRLDHYSSDIPLEHWRTFAGWVLGVFNISSETRNLDRTSIEKQIVLTLIERKSRKITNLGQLHDLTLKTYGSSLTVQMVDLSSMPMDEQLRFMRNTTILFGLDGTGLMNSLFMLNRCGVVIHIGTYKMRTISPGKGRNFEALMESGTDRKRFIYYEIDNLDDVSSIDRRKFEELSLLNLTNIDRFQLVTTQDIHLPENRYSDLLANAFSMTKMCLQSIETQ